MIDQFADQAAYTVIHTGIGPGAALAVVCSRQRNRSILWAILAGILSWIYVIYFALTRTSEETSRLCISEGTSRKLSLIETSRLVLRRYRMSDLDDAHGVLGDPETMVYYPEPYSRERLKRIIEKNIETFASAGFGMKLEKEFKNPGNRGFLTAVYSEQIERS